MSAGDPDTLPAGPALDEAIIREVMRWPIVKQRLSGPYPHAAWRTIGGFGWWGVFLDDGQESFAFAPSTDWKAAGMVAERFWSVVIEGCEGTIPRYTVTIIGRGLERQYQASGETFPLAMARCALRARREHGAKA